MTMLDFNRVNLGGSDLNKSINDLLDAAAAAQQRLERSRDYLGASIIGSECLRKVQYDWMCDAIFPARTKTIFERGHAMEEISARALARAGFRIERNTERTEFSTADDLFKGHADGIILDGPPVNLLRYPCLWEHKALGDSGWKKIEKDGLRRVYPVYYDQCQLYMAYLGLDENPALFTTLNANTCERLHLLVPFDAVAAQAASDRAARVIKATKAGELLDRITTKREDWRCRMCNWRERCWEGAPK